MSGTRCYRVLLAPSGQLSGDGQLRESINERRDRKGKDFPLWHLPYDLVREFNLSGSEVEAVVAEDPAIITWLQLRFGGEVFSANLSTEQLREKAMELPPSAPLADLGINKGEGCSSKDCIGTCGQNINADETFT